MIKRSPTSSTTASAVKVTFVLPLEAIDQPVSVVGEFNDWDPFAHPLRKRSNGTRSVTVELEPGRHYRFKYLAADGSWLTDPDAEAVDNGLSGVDSMIAA
jgi:1,4-alpha-glucan branching enzyme